MTDTPHPSTRPPFRGVFTALFVGLMVWQGALPAVEQLEVKALFKNRAVVVVDGKRRMLVPGKPSPEGVVLISSNSRHAVLEVDGVRDKWELGQRISSRFQAPTVQQQRVRLLSDGHGMYTASGQINGFSVPFVVDTGATLVSMNSILARRLGIDYQIVGEKALSETASGYATVYLVKLDSVRVGDIELKNVQGSVHEGEFPSISLLGMSFLGRLSMHRDGRVMELKQSGPPVGVPPRPPSPPESP